MQLWVYSQYSEVHMLRVTHFTGAEIEEQLSQISGASGKIWNHPSCRHTDSHTYHFLGTLPKFSKPILLVSDNTEWIYGNIYHWRNLESFKLVFHQSIQSRLAYQWQGCNMSSNAVHLFLYQLSLNSCKT